MPGPSPRWPGRPGSSCRSARRTPRWTPPARWPPPGSPVSTWTPTPSPRAPPARCGRPSRRPARRYVDGGIIGLPPDPGARRRRPARARHPALPGGRARRRATRPGPPRRWRRSSRAPPLNPEILRNDKPRRGVGPQDGLRRLDQGQRRAAPGGPRAGPGRGGGRTACWPSGRQSQPGLDRRSRAAARSAAGKGWRWVGEMEEISASMTADGLPGGFHQAAAEVFRARPRDRRRGGRGRAGRRGSSAPC